MPTYFNDNSEHNPSTSETHAHGTDLPSPTPALYTDAYNPGEGSFTGGGGGGGGGSASGGMFGRWRNLLSRGNQASDAAPEIDGTSETVDLVAEHERMVLPYRYSGNSIAKKLAEVRPNISPEAWINPDFGSIHPTASIAAGARIASGVHIRAGAVIGEDASIGPNTVIHPDVSIGQRANVGQNAEVHDRVQLGPQASVGDESQIFNDSVIGANTSVRDRVHVIPGTHVPADAIVTAEKTILRSDPNWIATFAMRLDDL